MFSIVPSDLHLEARKDLEYRYKRYLDKRFGKYLRFYAEQHRMEYHQLLDQEVVHLYLRFRMVVTI